MFTKGQEKFRGISVASLGALLLLIGAVEADTTHWWQESEELIEAASNGETETVKSLLAAGADVDVTDDAGETALSVAIYKDDTQTIKVLLDAGADLGAKDSLGMTSLISAAMLSTSPVVRVLLDAGADVNAKSIGGFTALMFAVGPTGLDKVRILLDAGADVNAKTENGYSALISAETDGHTEIAAVLREAGATWGQEDIDYINRERQREKNLEDQESAISTVKAILVAQSDYSINGEGKYAKNLPELAEAGLISSELATGLQDGYQFATNGEGETFTVNADPILVDAIGAHYLFANESGVIRWSMEGPATVFSLPLGH